MRVVSELQQALALHRAGRLAEAAAAYRQLLERAPADPEVLNSFGLLCHQRGDSEQALALLRRAVTLRPEAATLHLHLGLVLEHAGALEPALRAYREAARREPQATDLLFNQGVVLLKLSRPEEAEGCFRRVLAIAPEDAGAALNLGRTLAEQRRWGEACEACMRALALRPDWVAALNGQAGALRRLGRRREALAAYRRALALAPDDARLHNNLGAVQNELGQHREALVSYERALALDAELPEAHLNLSRMRRERGERAAALGHCRRALALAPGLPGAASVLASLLREETPPRFDPEIEAELLHLMRAAEVDAQDLARAAAHQVRRRHRLARRAGYESGQGSLPVAALARDELLLALLGGAINVDPDLEAALVALRRALLWNDSAGAEIERLRAALALQCFANEYVFATSEAECVRLDALAGALAPPAPGDPRWRRDLLRLAAYRPLWKFEALRGLRTSDLTVLPAGLARVLRRTLIEPLEEQALAGRIPSAGPVRDPVSRRVRAQYETGPYPRWLGISAEERTPVAESLARRFPHWVPGRALAAGARALVLGCGSGYEPIELAQREPRITVFAVDLSRASLAYATRMARDMGVRNVHFLHGDLLDPGGVEGTFELVSATGVLHHLRDPLAGWRVAAAKLCEGGLMRVGLYSRRARLGIVRARERIRRRSIPPTPEAMRRFRVSLLRGELGPDLAFLARSPDFYTLSGLRDLLFHVEEHHFDLAGVADALSSLGLRFVGFEHERPGVDLAYARMFPDDPSRTSLAHWAAFEDAHPETFTGMYQFWCERPAGEGASDGRLAGSRFESD